MQVLIEFGCLPSIANHNIAVKLCSYLLPSDICANFLCLRGSTCVVTERGPMCECPEGFKGQHCEDGEQTDV